MFEMARNFGKETNGHPGWRGDAALKEYTKLKAGDVVFVNSMSDTYHENVPILWIETIHNLIALKPEVTFLVLTKRPRRIWHISAYDLDWEWPDNVWLGTTIENKAVIADRLHWLAASNASHKFLSVEPLLESLMPEITRYGNLDVVDWMIVGGESGKKRRPFDKEWARELRDLCFNQGIFFTFKQGSAHHPGKDYELDGVTHLDTPFTAARRLREIRQAAIEKGNDDTRTSKENIAEQKISTTCGGSIAWKS